MLTERKSTSARPGARAPQKLKRRVYLQAPTPDYRKVNIYLFFLFHLACAVLLPVVEFPRSAKDGGRRRARPGLGLAGRPGKRQVLPPGFPGGPGAHRTSSPLPAAPRPPLGQVEDRGAPAGCCSHRREACLSTVEELPPQGAWQRLRADAHTGGPGGGGPGLPGQILPICFC